MLVVLVLAVLIVSLGVFGFGGSGGADTSETGVSGEQSCVSQKCKQIDEVWGWIDGPLGLGDKIWDPVKGWTSWSEVYTSQKITPERIFQVAYKYKGKPYGRGEGDFTCTKFIEQVLQDLGISITERMSKCIHVKIPEGELDSYIGQNNPLIRGVQQAFTEGGIGFAVAVGSAQRGDFIQYWFKKDGQWRGHAAIIENNLSGGKFNLFGAHESTGVSSKEVNLGALSKVYIARLKT